MSKQFGSRSGLTFAGLIWVQTVCKGHQQTTLVGQKIYFLQVTRLCDLSGDGDTVTSVSWAERVNIRTRTIGLD